MPPVKLKSLRILYKPRATDDEDVHAFVKAIKDESGYLACFCLYIEEDDVYSIFLKFNHQIYFSRLKKLMKGSDMNTGDIQIGKMRKGESEETLLATFVRFGLYQGGVPYVDYSLDLAEKYKDSLVNF